ncbi:MAG: acyl-CoA thioesterase [Acidimicrobiales bacterium]
MLELPVKSEIRVRFAEMDPYGHVNHAMYLTYLEQGRAEALEAADISLTRVAKEGFQFVITAVDAKYLVPATAKEPVIVETTISSLRRISGVWSQRIVSPDGDTVYLTADLKAGITDRRGRPAKPPAWMLEGLGRLCPPGDTG